MSFEIRDLDAPLGAEILSLDLSGVPNGAELRHVHQALAELGVPVDRAPPHERRVCKSRGGDRRGV